MAFSRGKAGKLNRNSDKKKHKTKQNKNKEETEGDSKKKTQTETHCHGETEASRTERLFFRGNVFLENEQRTMIQENNTDQTPQEQQQ